MRFLLGLLTGLVVMIPVGVSAWNSDQHAKPLIDVDRNSTVYVFDDQDNKCYVITANYSDALSISCVKRSQP